MSHIPSAAMPHAKPHEAPSPPVVARQPPWIMLAIGGAVVVGASLFLVAGRRKATPKSGKRRGDTASRKKSSAKAPRRKPKSGGRKAD